MVGVSIILIKISCYISFEHKNILNNGQHIFSLFALPFLFAKDNSLHQYDVSTVDIAYRATHFFNQLNFFK